jgi:hypothetical protein
VYKLAFAMPPCLASSRIARSGALPVAQRTNSSTAAANESDRSSTSCFNSVHDLKPYSRAPEQRGWISQELYEEEHISEHATTVWQALKSRTILLLAGLAFLNHFVLYTFAFWFPTMLKRQSLGRTFRVRFRSVLLQA